MFLTLLIVFASLSRRLLISDLSFLEWVISEEVRQWHIQLGNGSIGIG